LTRLLPGDLGRLVTVADPAVSPDGQHVTVTVSRVDVEANRYRSAIWLDGRPFTSGEESDHGARWSPDGAHIAFSRGVYLDADDMRYDLCVLAVDGGGEAVVLWSSPEEIDGIDWSPDGTRLTWASRVRDEGADAKARDREPRRIDTLFTRLDDVGWTVDRRTQVFVARVDGSEARRQMTDGPYEHQCPRWSPDGRSLVLSAARHDGWDLDVVVDLWVLDIDSGALRQVTRGDQAYRLPSWSPDGTRIAALALDERDGWRNTRPVVVDAETGAVTDVAPRIDRTFAPYPGERPPVWLDDRTLLVAREDRGRVGVLRVAADGSGEPEEVEGGERWISGHDWAGRTLAVVAGTSSSPSELFVDGVRRTHATDAFVEACPPLVPERFTVGEVDAWFVAPEGAAEPWPLIVSVHGGPMTQYGERWFDEWQLWASAGFAVVGCNPHGSSGRDDAWARAIRSPLAAVEPGTGWGGVDADDVLAVLDATLDRWPIDAARVGIHGGSYGGFMTSWLCARTDRFAAGCSERAVNNLLSEEWSSDVGGTFWRELGVSHLEHRDEYLRMSPATYVDGITCPILILHSEQDLRCNIEQADALFVPLRMRRHDVEYWRFPGESHELSRSGAPKHRIRRAELIIDFFQRKLAVDVSSYG
jgi:dipeptidyl aminopeptidase/acylaminoacyl peptidase